MRQGVIESAPVRHRYFKGAQGAIHALVFSEHGKQPPLLLLHGVTGSAWLWHDVAQTLAASRPVIALDMRGHGESDWSIDHAYTTEDHVADLQAVISELGAEQVDMAGLSWGALVGMAYAGVHPQRVRRFSIVEVEPSFGVDEFAVPERPQHFEKVEQVRKWERGANPVAPDALLELWARQSVRHATQGGWCRQHDPFFYKQWPFRRDNHWDALPKLSMPVLLVNGDRTFVRAEVMQEMAKRIPNARFERLTDCGHIAPLEAPATLAGLLATFFDGKG